MRGRLAHVPRTIKALVVSLLLVALLVVVAIAARGAHPSGHGRVAQRNVPNQVGDDLLTIQVDGTKGTAIAGLRHCWTQHYGNTPRPTWNPDIESPLNYFDGWQKVPEQDTFDNAFKRQWELYLRHVVKGEPFRWGLLEGAKGVQLAEKGIESWRKRAWVDVPEI